jgi:hypothetical protein
MLEVWLETLTELLNTGLVFAYEHQREPGRWHVLPIGELPFIAIKENVRIFATPAAMAIMPDSGQLAGWWPEGPQ